MFLWQRLTEIYSVGEAKAIVQLLLEDCFGISMADYLCGKVEDMVQCERDRLEGMMKRLEQGEPIQYVVGSATFCGRSFHVEPGVLIPRPETEELIALVKETLSSSLNSHASTPHAQRSMFHVPRTTYLDIGTGSGCIAITLALDMPNADVAAWDISEQALSIAESNAKALGANVRFVKQDILAPQRSTFSVPHLTSYDVIVSNPPYICRKEQSDMERNVLGYEPDMALFVPDDDPLRFYTAIAHYAVAALRDGGWLFFEINPLYAQDIVTLLNSRGFMETELRTDKFGKKRMIRTRKP